jgi:hypothetical protein
MNPNNQIIEFFENNGIIEFDENMVIENIVIVENPENNQINEPNVLNLGPPPVLQRHNPPVYFGADDAEELLADREYQGYDTPDEFVMPVPCSRCYWAQCNGTCELVTPFIQTIRATQLSFEEEMDLPPPPALTKNTHVYLMDEEWECPPPIPPPLTRGYTDSHLSDEILSRLAEAESNMRDEYEAAFFEQLQDNEQDEEQDKEQDEEQDGEQDK